MKQIVTVCTGQCGIRSGTELFELIQKQHFLSEEDTCESYVNSSSQGARQARMIAVDSDSSEIDRLMMTDIGRRIPLQNMIFSGPASNGSYAKARGECLPDILEVLYDAIRCELQRCESPQLIQLHYGLGGGAGSALGNSVLEYPFGLKSSVSVMPAAKLSSSLIQPYNATLGLRDLYHNCQQSLLFCNDSLHSHLKVTFADEKITLRDLNRLVAVALGDFTAADRYRRGENIRKRMVNLLPYPSLHFFGYALGGPTSFSDVLELQRTFMDLHNPKYGLSGVDRTGVYVGLNLIVRGDTATSPFYNIELKRLKERLHKHHRHRYPLEFCDYMNDIYVTTCPVPRHNKAGATSVSSVFNNSAMQQPLRKITDRCQKLFSKKAFLHVFGQYGVEMDEINESLGELHGLMHEYSSLGSHGDCYGEEEDDSDCC